MYLWTVTSISSVLVLPNTPVSLGPWNPDFRVVGSEKKREREGLLESFNSYIMHCTSHFDAPHTIQGKSSMLCCSGLCVLYK